MWTYSLRALSAVAPLPGKSNNTISPKAHLAFSFTPVTAEIFIIYLSHSWAQVFTRLVVHSWGCISELKRLGIHLQPMPSMATKLVPAFGRLPQFLTIDLSPGLFECPAAVTRGQQDRNVTFYCTEVKAPIRFHDATESLLGNTDITDITGVPVPRKCAY